MGAHRSSRLVRLALKALKWPLAPLVIVSALAPARGEAAAARVLTVEAEPRHVVLGGAGPDTVTLRIRVADAAGAPVPEAQVIARSTAGDVADLRRVGPGQFEARLLPPEDQFPQLAVVNVAEVSPVVRGEPPVVTAIGVAYSARIDLRGRSEPGARLRVEVGKRTFGPVRARKDGSFVVPVVVPPGEGWATSVAVDELGNTSRSRINLYLPEVARLHAFMYPEVLIADGSDRGWLYVTTVDTTGAPEQRAVSVRGSRGEVGAAERVMPGLSRLSYRAPAELGDATDRVVLSIPRSSIRAEVRVQLMAAAPEALSIQTTPAIAPADGATPVTVRLEVRDALGNPADGHDVRVDTGSEAARTEHVGPGTYEVRLAPRSAVQSLTLPVAVVPRTASCPRPWAGRAPDGTIRIRDVRGILCTLSFAVLGPDGAVVHQGRTTELGELTLPPELPPWDARLVVQGVGGGAPDVLWAGRDQVSDPVPILHGAAKVVYRLPAPVSLALRPVSRDRGRVVLGLEADGAGASVVEQVEVRSTWGTPRLEAEGDGRARIVLESTEGPPARVDVVATHRATGVSAWLRVE